MKVLQINSVCGIGSTGRIATDIHKILIEQGHESYIAYGRDLPKNCDNAIKIGTKLDNYTHVAKTRIFDKHGFGSKKATIEFIEKVKELNPDIIHLHNIHGYYINVEVLFNYLKETDKPIIWTLHDCWSFTGHCSHFDYIGCEKWKTSCNSCPQKLEYPKSILLDNSRSNYLKKKDLFTGVKNLTIITPSKWLAGRVKDSYLNKYSVQVINNGIDLDIFKPTESNIRQKYKINDKFVILGVSSIWNKKKGLHHFVELSKIISPNEVIVLVGLDRNQVNNLPDNIITITKTNDTRELAEIYSASDVFVNLTLEDTFPTVNLESRACGLPVITYNTGGSSESISTAYGMVIKQNMIDTVLHAINDIKTQRLKNHSKIIASECNYLFDKNKQFLKYINLYKEINQ